MAQEERLGKVCLDWHIIIKFFCMKAPAGIEDTDWGSEYANRRGSIRSTDSN